MKYLIVNVSFLNLRTEPSLNSEIISVMKKDEVIKVLSFSPDYYWVKVERADNQIGWASYKHLLGLPDKEALLDSDALWLKIALGELGIKEFKDPMENQRIVQYLISCRNGLSESEIQSDETAWCSAFTNWCIEKAGYEGTHSAWALSWRTWGKPIAEPQRGCIAVFERYITTNGKIQIYGHVGFFLKDNVNSISLLGGNQGNQGEVSIRDFPKKNNRYKLIGYRVPHQ